MVCMRGYVWCGISSVVSAFALLGFSASHVHASSHKDLFYVGLWYGPTISEISEFKVGVPGETRRVLPILVGRSRLFGSDNFDWQVESDPVINFRKSSPYGLRGGIGYNAHGMRIEAEFGHEKYDVISRKGGRAFLLAKAASVNVLTEQGIGSIPLALEQFTKEEISNFKKYLLEKFKDNEGFKNALGESDSSMSGLVGVVVKAIEKTTVVAVKTVEGLLNIVSKLIGLSSSLFSSEEEKDNAEAASSAAVVAQALSQLQLEADKVKLAQAISSGLEGAEVVEIGSLRTTSLMLNACYDFPQVLALGWYMSPYLCGGGGGSIVSLGGEHLNLRPAYRVKLGINYSFSETFSMFAGGVYHRILGKRYNDIPANRMEDDITFVERTKESVSAQFELKYWGVEVGVRYAF